MASENLIEELHFENLVIKVDAQDFFKLKNQKIPCRYYFMEEL